MSPPPARLRDESPQIERALRALDGEGPDPAVIARVLALPESTPVAAGRSSALRTTSVTAKWSLVVTCVVALGASGMATSKSLFTATPAASPSAIESVAAMPLSPLPSSPSSSAEVATGSLPTFTVDELPTAAAPTPVTTLVAPPMPSPPPSPRSGGDAARPASLAQSPASPSVAPVASTFHEELALIEAARGALSRRDGQSALAVLDRYDETFASGALSSEAAITRVEALAALGRADAARHAAERFLGSSAASPYAARVRAILDRLPPRDAATSSDTDRKGPHR